MKFGILVLVILHTSFRESKSDSCGSFDTKYEELIIDESSNQMKFLCNQKPEFVLWLEIKDFSLPQFPNELIQNFPKLRSISIELKNNLDILSENFFTEEVYETIHFLKIVPVSDLPVNCMKNLQFNFNAKFPNLEYLWINQFNFESLRYIKFSDKLTDLWLGQNQIKNLPEDSFINLSNLKDLSLTQNELKILHENLLQNNKKLKVIQFANNKIKKIPRKFFAELTEVIYVSFDENLIEYLPADLFKSTRKLRHAKFSHNKIQRLSPDIFDGLNLREKRFGGNPCVGDELWENSNLVNCFTEWNRHGSLEEEDYDHNECGRPKNIRPFSIGGWGTSRGKYPWSAAFFINNNFNCSSSLITNRHILLAAHCIQNKGQLQPVDPTNCHVSLGRCDLNAKESDSLDVGVSEFIINPDWDFISMSYKGDIALAVLKTEVKFTEYISPICLNDQKLLNFYDNTATLTGWGATVMNPRLKSNISLEVSVKVKETRECLSEDPILMYFISKTSFCAGNRNNTGACVGDSGAALFVKDENGRFTAIGIVSAGLFNDKNECDAYTNQLYTEIAPYYEWILENTNELDIRFG